MVFERVVMFIMSELPCLYHFDVRCSLIADLQLSQPVYFMPEAGSLILLIEYKEACRLSN